MTETDQLLHRLRTSGGSICLLRLSSIGDVVLCTPVIRWLQQEFPLVRLHFVTKKGMEPLLEANHRLHAIHQWDGNESALLDELAQQSFDAWIDLHNNWRTLRWYLRMRLRGQHLPRLALSKNNLGKWWMVQTKKRPQSIIHTVQKYQKMLAPWGISDDGKGLELPLTPRPGPSLHERMGWETGRPIMALALGAQHATKCMTEDQLLSLCRSLPGPLLLMGGPTDRERAERLQAQSGRSDLAHRCGEWGLQESAWALSQCACLLTPDTGLMHIASALGIKTLVVWGNTLPEFGMHPWLAQPAPTALRWEDGRLVGNASTGSQAPNAVLKDLPSAGPEYFETATPCRPCSKLGHPQCPRGHFDCMRSQDLNLVTQRARLALQQSEQS